MLLFYCEISVIAVQKPPLKREDSFLQRFSTRQIPETQETVEDTGSEGCSGDPHSSTRRRRRFRKQPKTVVNPDENFYFYWLLIITVCILYNLWTLIVRQSFPELQVPGISSSPFSRLHGFVIWVIGKLRWFIDLDDCWNKLL